MVRIEGAAREVLEKTEWLALATVSPQGPHVVATWGDYVRRLGLDGPVLLLPAGAYHQTEKNLQADDRVELLCGSRQVAGANGPGNGCSIRGRGRMEISGPNFAAVKAQFP